MATVSGHIVNAGSRRLKATIIIIRIDTLIYAYAQGFKDSVVYLANVYVVIMYQCVPCSD